MIFVKISFISLRLSCVLEYRGRIDLLGEFMSIFVHDLKEANKTIIIQPIQINTLELSEKFIDFVEDNRGQIPKEVNFFRQFLKALSIGDVFFITLGEIKSTETLQKIYSQITKIQIERGVATSSIDYSLESLEFLKKFDLRIFGHQRRLLGSKDLDKKDLVCRFCGVRNGEINKNGNITTFRNKAHVIPEALGNKKLISFDECDHCNSEFGKGIDQSLINYLSVFRAIYGIKGKNGLKKIKGRNFTFDFSKGFDIKLSGNIDGSTEKVNCRLKGFDSFIPQDLYKSLVKIVINTLEQDELINFDRTISWVTSSDYTKFLPKIIMTQAQPLFVDEPMLVTYIRKTDDYSIPFIVGEFRFADISFCFIVPFSRRDTKTFLKNSDYEIFLQVFKNGIRSNIECFSQSFSSKNRQNICVDLKIDGIKLGENAFIRSTR